MRAFAPLYGFDLDNLWGIVTMSGTDGNMRMISCSRSGVEPLKFWWLLQTVGIAGWTEQATAIKDNTAYLVAELRRIGWPCWNNEYSNTVFFRRPAAALVTKYNLANSYDDRFGAPSPT